MATPVSPTNDDSQNVDGLMVSTGVTSVWHRALDGSAITPTNSDQQAAAELFGTHVPAEVLASTDPVVLVAASVGGTIYPLEAGTAATGTAAVLHVRDVGLGGTVVQHAIAVATAATSIGTGIASGRKVIEFYNGGTQVVYLGNSTVGTANGFPIGTASYGYYQTSAPIYAITGGGTATLRIVEMA